MVIPAHNESSGLSPTLRSIREVDYPAHLYDVVVVADNCSDDTAEVAETEGVRCLKRDDASKKGKGYALAYAVDELMKERYDGFVFIDADSVVSRNFLQVMNDRLLAGHPVVQAYYGISNPDASPLSYLFLIGNTVENKLFYAAKSRLGLPVNLRGNGMCFSRRMLLHNPWSSFSIVEDVEYGLKLIRQGIRIHFECEARVLARQPETFGQAHIQRVRWASGTLSVSKAHAVKLMCYGLSEKSMAVVDAGFSLLVLSRPLLLLLSLMSAVLSLAYRAAGGGAFHAGWALSVLLAQTAYLMAGVFMERLDCRRITYLILAPFVVVWFFFITVLGLAGYREGLWLRTKRV